ncbi:hypothetical protein [Zoogloea sp.]|uniref:hypothetical protein n=1 Tax=Zoogloea sp. TaxID=49181 RepID=UPI00260EC414|nr:hypothetical protein [uncultured Zoogloea sp.]MCK6386051.1 hypothetical protein [Zoogloea sp.]
MSLVIRHLARHSGSAQPVEPRRPVPTASLIVLACIGAAGGLLALNLIMQFYTPG